MLNAITSFYWFGYFNLFLLRGLYSKRYIFLTISILLTLSTASHFHLTCLVKLYCFLKNLTITGFLRPFEYSVFGFHVTSLSNTGTASKPFLLLIPPHSKVAVGVQGIGRGKNWESYAQLTKEVSHIMWCHAEHIELRKVKKDGGTTMFGVTSFGFTSQLHVIEPCFPRDGQTPIWTCEVVNGFLISIFLYMASALPIKLCVGLCSSHSMSFLTCALLILSPMLLVREWVTGCM